MTDRYVIRPGADVGWYVLDTRPACSVGSCAHVVAYELGRFEASCRAAELNALARSGHSIAA